MSLGTTSRASTMLVTLALAAGCAHTSATPGTPRTPAEERRARVVARYFDEVWSQGRLDVWTSSSLPTT